MMKKTWVWADLMELKGKTIAEVVEWFMERGKTKEDFEWDSNHTPIDVLLADKEAQDDCAVYIGGFWADRVPVIEFDEGIVARWYRSEAWD